MDLIAQSFTQSSDHAILPHLRGAVSNRTNAIEKRSEKDFSAANRRDNFPENRRHDFDAQEAQELLTRGGASSSTEEVKLVYRVFSIC